MVCGFQRKVNAEVSWIIPKLGKTGGEAIKPSLFIGVSMLKNSDIKWDRFQKYHDLIESHLPPNYTFGYVGSIWGKWASDDRYFYIEDADGRKVTSGWDCNHMQECWEKLCVHIVTKVIGYGGSGWGVNP